MLILFTQSCVRRSCRATKLLLVLRLRLESGDSVYERSRNDEKR